MAFKRINLNLVTVALSLTGRVLWGHASSGKPLCPPWSRSSILRTDYWLYAALCSAHRDPRTQTHERHNKKYRTQWRSEKRTANTHSSAHMLQAWTSAGALTGCLCMSTLSARVHDPHVCHCAVCFALYNRMWCAPRCRIRDVDDSDAAAD